MQKQIILKEEVLLRAQSALEAAFSDADSDDIPRVELTQATKSHFGHYQCNSAMSLAKIFKKNPREIALAWSDAMILYDQNHAQTTKACKMFEKIEVAGPGFINITLSSPFLSAKLKEAAWQQMCFDVHASTAVVDYSSPNIAKQMHVGHLRSTIIGESLRRLLTYCGWSVKGVNHVGDWGTQFGMLITYICEEGLDTEDWLLGSGKDSIDSALALENLMQLYRSARVSFTEDNAFALRAKKAVVDLQSGNTVLRALWERICEISRVDFSKIYKMLQVEIEEKGESFYQSMLAPTVKDLEERGIAKISDGALCVFLPEFKIPYMLRKSDGGYNYDTTDIAALRYRVDHEGAKRLIYVTDAGQKLHFDLLFATAKAAGYVTEQHRLEHVGFGLVLGKDGKKFKTREGETEKLIDLISEAVLRSKKMIVERQSSVSQNELENSELAERARRIGVSAVKYADLSNDRMSDYQFSYDKMLAFEGNTAIFLFYSLVRAKSILRKLKNCSYSEIETFAPSCEQPSEIQLVLALLQWPEAIALTRDTLAPHRLAEYLYQLACNFNHFFRDCKVHGDAKESARARLVLETVKVLEAGMHILGLEPVESM